MKVYIYSEREFSVFCDAVALCLAWGAGKQFCADGTKFFVENHYGSVVCSMDKKTWRVPVNFYKDLERLNHQKFGERPYEITD